MPFTRWRGGERVHGKMEIPIPLATDDP